jgi:hypothetical protein
MEWAEDHGHPPEPFSTPQPCNTPASSVVHCSGPPSSIPSASEFGIKNCLNSANISGDGSSDGTSTHCVNGAFTEVGSEAGWELLARHTAPNALHDSRARHDAPKCDEDTRVEVTKEIMKWAEDHGRPPALSMVHWRSRSGSPSFIQSEFQMRDFLNNSNISGDRSSDGTSTQCVNGVFTKVSSEAGWEMLARPTALNALHDSRARYDALKCNEDTRVEVTKKLVEWVDICDGGSRPPDPKGISNGRGFFLLFFLFFVLFLFFSFFLFF